MLELKQWISRADLPDKPWLVLGKGPTFEKVGGRYFYNKAELAEWSAEYGRDRLRSDNMADAFSMAKRLAALVADLGPLAVEARTERCG